MTLLLSDNSIELSRASLGCLSVARGESERSHAGAPVKAAGCNVIFLGVPEGAVVLWIDGHAAVITPALETVDLDAGAVRQEERRLHGARRISRCPSNYGNARIDAVAGDAEAERNISNAIHRDAAHPVIQARINYGAFLEDKRRRVWISDFIPTYSRKRAPFDAVGRHQRLVVAEVAVG